MNLGDIGRLFRTVRHLKPVQVTARLAGFFPKNLPGQAPPPPLRPIVGNWAAPIERPPSLIDENRARFLNREESIAGPGVWNAPALPKLWLYNLHYFDDLGRRADEAHVGLQRHFMARWIAENPPAKGNGWEPYPVSIRLVNWVKWHLAGNALDDDALHSLAVQARWLARNIEWRLLGNHLFANAKALVFAGLFFDGPEARAWLDEGARILAAEIPEQILPDGGHFELSPMYHSIILEDVLDLINLARAFGVGESGVLRALPETARRMRFWLSATCHPDGGISFFNDAAFAIAAGPIELEAYGDRLGLAGDGAPTGSVVHLRDSGYVRVAKGPFTAILDVARVGPDYIPGHAHADTLSFELSVGLDRVVVNGGASTYEPGAQRERERGTPAHSTVAIDGGDSSEVWAGFRVGRRARPSAVRIEETGDAITVSASHDGYAHLPGHPIHHRTWTITPSDFTIVDRIDGAHGSRAVARFLLHPAVAPNGKSVLDLPSGARVSVEASAPAHVAAHDWHPEFGVARAAPALEIHLADGPLTTRFFPA